MSTFGYPLPKNRNLDRGPNMGDASSSLRRKVAWFGDSQLEQTSQRFGAFIPLESPAEVTGIQLYMLSQQSVGAYNLNATVSNMTRRNPQPATSASDANARWSGDNNESDNLGYSLELAFSANITINTEIHRFGIVGPSNFNAIDLDDRWIFRHLFRNNPDNIDYIKWLPFSGASVGAATEIEFDPTPIPFDISYEDLILPSVADLGGAGNTPRGIILQTGQGNDAGKYHQVLGNAAFRSDSGSTMVDYGLMFASVFQGGYSAFDLINRISPIARRGLIRAWEGFDEFWISIGHNAEDEGTTPENIVALAKTIMVDHYELGYPAPKIGIYIPWYAPDAALDRETVYRLDMMAAERSWMVVNGWMIYNETDPATNGADYFGSPRTYTMDGGTLHPGNATTARYIAEDFWSAFLDREDSYNRPYIWQNTI